MFLTYLFICAFDSNSVNCNKLLLFSIFYMKIISCCDCHLSIIFYYKLISEILSSCTQRRHDETNWSVTKTRLLHTQINNKPKDISFPVIIKLTTFVRTNVYHIYGSKRERIPSNWFVFSTNPSLPSYSGGIDQHLLDIQLNLDNIHSLWSIIIRLIHSVCHRITHHFKIFDERSRRIDPGGNILVFHVLPPSSCFVILETTTHLSHGPQQYK